MSAHTPGPWTALLGQFDYANDGSRRVMCGDPDSDDYRRVATVDTVAERKLRGKQATPYDAPDAERDANARLIAAAPELLAALQKFVTAAKSWHDCHHGSTTIQCDWLCECIPDGERAIANATGSAK